VLPSFAFDAGNPESVLLAVNVPANARFVVEEIPLPDSDAVVGLLLALLVTVNVPVNAPPEAGANPTFTVHDAPTAIVEQLLVSLKLPVTATLDTVAEVVPELDTVTDCAAADEPTNVPGNDKLAGVMLSTGPGTVPVPERLTPIGLLVALLVTASVPVWAPPEVGAKVTDTVQDAPAARAPPQLFVSLNCPVAAINEIVMAAEPGLLTVTL
jgi:hypothetical protein